VTLGETIVYYLPTYDDNEETDSHTVSLTLKGFDLPEFFSFSEDNHALSIFPEDPADVGVYTVWLEIEDDDSSNSGQTKKLADTFEVEVLDVVDCMSGLYSDITIDVSVGLSESLTNSYEGVS